MGQPPDTQGKPPSSMRHTASSLVSTQSPQQQAPRMPQGHCLTASGVRSSDSSSLPDILGHTPLHRLYSQRAKTALPLPLGCPGDLTILCYANSDPQWELKTAPQDGCSHCLWLTSLSPGQGQSLLQTPQESPAPGPQAQVPAKARGPGGGEPPPTFDGFQIVIIEEDGKVQLVLGTAPRLVAWAVPTVGVGLRLRGVHGWGSWAAGPGRVAVRGGGSRGPESPCLGRTPGPGMTRGAVGPGRVRGAGDGASFLLKAPVAAWRGRGGGTAVAGGAGRRPDGEGHSPVWPERQAQATSASPATV